MLFAIREMFRLLRSIFDPGIPDYRHANSISFYEEKTNWLPNLVCRKADDVFAVLPDGGLTNREAIQQMQQHKEPYMWHSSI